MIKIGNSDISQAFLGTVNVIAAYLGEIQIFGSEASQYLTFEAATNNCQIKFYAVNSSNTKTILVSTDKSTWTSKTSSISGTVLATLNSGLKLYVKGNNNAYSDSNGYSNSILPTANCYVYGNVMSLIDGSNFKTLTTISTNYAFKDLFNSSKYSSNINSLFILKKSRKNIVLPATTLTDYCYLSMFSSCSSLTIAPKLPATTLASYCYSSMFNGCSSLTSAPELPATTLANNCYSSMFNGCSSLTSAPELPATTLTNSCYSYMFENCSSLTSAPELHATTLADDCYNGLFYNCSSLTNAPELPATILTDYCYESMFENCSSLTSTPELPATTLADYCYESMFENCSSLTSAPELPAITLALGCYSYMFSNCSNLTNAPELPATTLASYCYSSMFNGCSSLTSAPNLFAITLLPYCYNSMFSGCSNLNYIRCIALDIPTNGHCTDNWVSGVASTGTFVKNIFMDDWTIGDNGVPTNWEIENYYAGLKLLSTGETTISMSNNGGNAPSLDYSFDNGVNWTLWDYSAITLHDCDELSIKGNNLNGFSSSSSIYSNFVFGGTGTISASGNIMSLLDNGRCALTSIPNNYCFYRLFYNCSSLTSAPELPATTLANNCYFGMFYGCSSLTSAPELPATTLASYCYDSMFRDCSSLTSAPELPATTLVSYCYLSMFNGCSSLTSAPELPATTLASFCYNSMFYNCSRLSYIKCLATTRINQNNSTTNWVYGVASTGTFIKDSNTTWPTGVNGIPAGWATFNANTLLFKSTGNSTIGLLSKSSVHILEYSLDNIIWTNMTISTNIQLVDKQIVSIRGILSGNLSMNNYTQFKMTGSIEVLGNCNALWNYNNLSESLKQYCGYHLFSNCSSLTSAPELPATTLANLCYYYMFSGCSSLTSAPELPATTLASYCYYNMFYNCSNLTSAPELPATTLVSYCYYNMFNGCSRLSYIKCLATTGINQNNSTLNWVSGVASTGTFIKDSNATWPTGVNGIPANWTVQPAA